MYNPGAGGVFLNRKYEAKICFQKVQKLIRYNLRIRTSATAVRGCSQRVQRQKSQFVVMYKQHLRFFYDKLSNRKN